jgi:hypothetical protein
MAEQAKQERESDRKHESQGNLGQKEARQQAQSDKEMSQMGERTKDKSK